MNYDGRQGPKADQIGKPPVARRRQAKHTNTEQKGNAPSEARSREEWQLSGSRAAMWDFETQTVISPTFTNYGDFRAKIVGPLETVYVGTSKM